MNSDRRRGFALLSVVVISALLIVSALMFVVQGRTESHVTKTDALFKSSLNIAESGLNTVLRDIRIGHPSYWAERFYSFPAGTTVGPVAVSAVHGTYLVTVAVVGTPAEEILYDEPAGRGTDIWYSGTLRLTSTGAVYPPSVTSMEGSTAFQARRIIETHVDATWRRTAANDVVTTPHVTPIPWEVKYGIFAGTGIKIWGSSQEINGPIFTNGTLDLKKATSVTNGDAYSSTGTLSSGNFPTARVHGVGEIPFPEIDTSYYQILYDAYLRGEYPYNRNDNPIPGTGVNGVPPAYYAWTAAVIGSARGTLGVQDLQDLSVLKDGLYVLPSAKVATAMSLNLLRESSAAYYVDGDLRFTGGAIGGTLVVDGDFTLAGGFSIASGPMMPALIIDGILERESGGGSVEYNMSGLVYINGYVGDAAHPAGDYQPQDLGLSIIGVGSGAINGALIARGKVDLNGNWSLTYDDDLSSLVIGGEVHQTTEVTPGQTVYDVEQLALPAENLRSWRELDG